MLCIMTCTHVALAAEPFEQVVGLELVLLVGHHAGHFERQPGLGHLVLEQALAHGVERRLHHVAGGHRPEIVHREHVERKRIIFVVYVILIVESALPRSPAADGVYVLRRAFSGSSPAFSTVLRQNCKGIAPL